MQRYPSIQKKQLLTGWRLVEAGSLWAYFRHGGFLGPTVKHLIWSFRQSSKIGDLKCRWAGCKIRTNPQRMHSATPDLGQHTLEILDEIGIKEEFDNLRKNGVV